jgi:hypothetical protein
MTDPHLLALILLAPFAANGIWFCLFCSPLIPHLVGTILRTGPLREDEFRLLLAAQGRFKTLHLWTCRACQAMWTALVSFAIWLALAYHFSLSGYWYLLLAFGCFALMPAFWLLQGLFGIKPVGTAEKTETAPEPPQQEKIRQKLSRSLTPEEMRIMNFFINTPCDFPGCDELRAAYKRDRIAAEEASCAPCAQSDIMRAYREKLRVIYDYSKEQVPDLLPELATAHAPSANTVAKTA